MSSDGQIRPNAPTPPHGSYGAPPPHPKPPRDAARAEAPAAVAGSLASDRADALRPTARRTPFPLDAIEIC